MTLCLNTLLCTWNDQQKSWSFFTCLKFCWIFPQVVHRGDSTCGLCKNSASRVNIELWYWVEWNISSWPCLWDNKSVLRRNNNYQRVKNGLIQGLFNLWQVWQTLIEPYPNSVCSLPQERMLSKWGRMSYLRIFISKGNRSSIHVNNF